MESKYITLSDSMHELITLREVLKEIYGYVLADTLHVELNYSPIHKYGQISQSIFHESNEACLKCSF